MAFSKKELDILESALGMYRAKLKKLMKDSAAIKAGEADIKKTFLEAESLSGKLQRGI